MKNFFKKVKRTFFTKKFLEFTILGGINTLNTAIFSHIANKIVQENIATVIGYIISLTIAYFINCMVIFKDKLSINGYLKFWISYIPNFIIFFLVTFITINTLGLPQFWATVLAAMVAGPVTFIIMKIFAFKKNI